MPLITFEWHVHEIDSGPHRTRVFVRETAGSDSVWYGPFPRDLVDSFIKARREAVHRQLRKHDAIKVLTP